MQATFPPHSDRQRRRVRLSAAALALTLVGGTGAWLARDPTPDWPDYVDIGQVNQLTSTWPPTPGDTAGTGSYTWSCGRNEIGHRNSANVVVTPGSTGPVHHTHEYVGNTSTGADSTDASLAAAGTTCDNDDRSTYYWPVLRLAPPDGGQDGQHGAIQTPAAVTLTLYGSPVGPVVAPPGGLRAAVGDALAVTDGGRHAAATWTCADSPRRRTDRYPRCGPGQRVLRVFDFPSCWDGRRTDSRDHREHLVPTAADGHCPPRTFPVPQLQVIVAYDLPTGRRFLVDAFADQNHSPRTDHAFALNLMPAPVLAEAVSCLNAGRACRG
ncbi:hypothetical protein GCM10010124_30940 [Pilimelia terevasa]|uniref:DUF1996 domain-containing protein n=1 Tax=Pilimelia terevasa TaxID=53372 RepID=A0A8J3BQK4_9ACTN|nr:DUF1996 domain-containing protein [Pilimelia terevasa]GGK36098.1 hypothetical protein GCM10010124_30940 [Pilimelia terevasa]